MKTILAALLSLLAWGAQAAPDREPIEIRELAVAGRIEGDNLSFQLAFTARVTKADAVLPLVTGPVALQDVPAGLVDDLRRDPDGYSLRCEDRGERVVSFGFIVQPARQGDALVTSLLLPVAPLRRVSIQCDREDLDVRFDGALDVKREKNAGGALVTAVLPPTVPLVVRWQPKVRRLAGELVVECDVNSMAVARAGALRLDSLYSFRIAQGALLKLAFDVPAGETVTQVRGADVREWSVDGAGTGRVLNVTLSRAQEKAYQMHVEHERALPPLPCEIDLAPLAPRDVLRASGFALVGAEGAVRLIVKRASGLTQIDRAAFAVMPMNGISRLVPPDRGSYAYQFANLPYQLSLSAEDIVTSVQAEERLTLSIADNDATLEAAVDLDVRDAPAREVAIETSPDWNVTAVDGANVADHDIRDEAGVRTVRIYFRNAVTGRQLVNLRLERTLPASAATFEAPKFRVAAARSERGYLALRGELGVTLRPAKDDGLREVPTGSLPVKVAGAQYAARFKAPDWKLEIAVVREQASISAEIFDLATFGESAVYGSSLVTYLINGAPVRSLRLAIPEGWRNVEVTGRDVRSWRIENGVCLVSLQEKIVGDYTLLVTHDIAVPYEAGEVHAGGLRALDAAGAGGYLVLAAPPGVALVDATNRPAGLLPIAAEELPPEYAVMIKDPVLRAYKYAGAVHEATAAFRRYSAKDLLDHAADLVLLRTRLSEEGEAVTELTCQVKNASRQYLGISLPAGSRLWSVSVDGVKAQALERGEGKILVPLPRRLDPNQPTRIDVVSASQAGKLGWREKVALQAPALEAKSIYARWTLTPPVRHRIASVTGDLTPPVQVEGGLRSFAVHAGTFATQLAMRGCGWIALLLIVTGLVAVIVFNVARGRANSLGTWTACAVAIVVGGVTIAAAPFHPPGRLVPAPVPMPLLPPQQVDQQQQIAIAPENPFAWTLSKPVTLSEGGLRLTAVLERDWVGTARTWGWPSIGAIVFGLALFAARRRPFVVALSGVVALAAVSQVPAAIPPVAAWFVAGVLLALAVGCIRAAGRAGRARQVAPEPIEPEPLPVVAADGGFADLRVVLLAAVCSLLALGALAEKQVEAAPVAQPVAAAVVKPPVKPVPPPPAPLPALIATRVTASVELPAPAADGTPPADANVEIRMTVDAEKAGDYLLLPGRYVLTAFTASVKRVEVIAKSGGYWLRFDRSGPCGIGFKYRAPVADVQGALQSELFLPPHLANEIAVKLPGPEWLVETPAAAYLKMGEGKELGTARIVAARGSVPLSWRPRTREARLEKAAFFAELQTVARLRPGLANLSHFVRYQIAQGELQTLRFDIPAGASVTAVSGPGLGTWRFDPATRLLEAVLEKPVSSSYALRVVTQVAREGLPYEAELREIVVRDAEGQRGVIALVADDGVQVVAGEATGCAAMHPGDFPAEALTAEAGQAGGVDVKRAYRYQKPPVTIPVSASRVLAEVRAVEEARVDITDERIVLSSRLQLDIAKAGVFTVWLELPAGFDIDALSGEDVSHWDEVHENGRAVAVHFTRQAQGARALNVVLSRQERGRLDELDVPRIAVRGALKHTGTLAVSAERGLRTSTVRREGATEVNPRELGIQQAGYLGFRLLRPDWVLRLKIEAAQPVVKAEVVERVTLSEGLMQARSRVVYSIEHAGVKLFRLRAPRPDAALVVTGPGLARVQLADATNGIWEIELQTKREGSVALDVNYQVPYEAASGRAVIRGLRCEGIDGQRGYLAVMAGGRLEVKAGETGDALEPEDPRAVPTRLGAGDLSAAALCFRATKGDVELPVTVTRHEAADLLSARVESADLTSVLTEDGSMATLALLRLDNGNLRFLRAKLPAGADVWSVFVNGRAVKPLTEADRLLIPLTAASAGAAEVELMYGTRLVAGWTGRREVPGPSFDLPLQNVTWRMYVPPGARYRGFEGTMTYREDRETPWVAFSAENYEQVNRVISADNSRKAAQVLQQGQELSKAGRQVEARQMLEEAISYSRGDRSLNEDARIQFQSLARQQAVVGLAARRSALKIMGNNAAPEDIAQTQLFNGGNYSADFGAQVSKNLGAKENDSLSLVADKLLEQQVAASGEVHPVRVTLPLEGRVLTFVRELQVQPGADVNVSFTTGSGALIRWLLIGASAAALALVLALSARFAFGR